MIPKGDLPRERLIRNGVESLSDQELLCLILRSGIKGSNMYTLAYAILNKVGGVSGLLNIRVGELLEIDGLKLAKACSILAAIELTKRAVLASSIDKKRVQNMDDVFNLIQHDILDPFQEQFYLVCINKKREVIACNKLFKGSASSHMIHPRDIFREAVKNNAEYIVVAHNHPSGDLTPSNDDISTTKALKKLGDQMGIHVVDHLIISNRGFLSLREKGIFDEEMI